MQNIEIPCPFCGKSVEVLFERESFVKKSSHAAGRTKYQYVHKGERYEALEDCPSCGKSKKEIQIILGGGSQSKPKSKEELKKQLEELGLSGKI